VFKTLWECVIFESDNFEGNIPEKILNSCRNQDIPELFHSLICAGGMAKFCLIKNKQGKIEEAIKALCYANFCCGLFLMSFHKNKNNPASELAKKRHSGNNALFDEAIKYWNEEIPPSISASKAADELVRVVPLSHRKLSDLVSAEKKKRQQSR
jgi:hypothetical protein